MLDKVKEIIENEINPQLESHSGGCEVVSVEDGVVTIRLLGGCAGCPGRRMTLLNGIVPILKKRIPEIKDVVLG
ncbi:MAG: NifU family protein [Oligoflexales bacterium]|nr:NifU family protein [Oligoflexales bacterium]